MTGEHIALLKAKVFLAAHRMVELHQAGKEICAEENQLLAAAREFSNAVAEYDDRLWNAAKQPEIGQTCSFP